MAICLIGSGVAAIGSLVEPCDETPLFAGSIVNLDVHRLIGFEGTKQLLHRRSARAGPNVGTKTNSGFNRDCCFATSLLLLLGQAGPGTFFRLLEHLPVFLSEAAGRFGLTDTVS